MKLNDLVIMYGDETDKYIPYSENLYEFLCENFPDSTERINMLFQIYSHNNSVTTALLANNTALEKKVDELSKGSSTNIKEQTSYIPKSVKKRKDPIKQTTKFGHNITSYKDQLESCDDFSSFETFLPDRHNKDYDSLITLIKLELLKQIKCARSYRKTADSKAEDDFYRNEETKYEVKLAAVREYHRESKDETDELTDSSLSGINIIYLKDEDGTPCVLSDIEGIINSPANLSLQSIANLFTSVTEGHFPLYKRYSVMDTYNDTFINSTRRSVARIIFDKVDERTYILCKAHIKRSSKVSGYHTEMVNRANLYERQREEIKAQLHSDKKEQLLQEGRETTEQIKRLLSPKKKVKGGRHND